MLSLAPYSSSVYAEGSGTNSSNDPLSGYTRTTYGPDFEAIFAQGVGHTVPEQANDVLRFFGLV